jgi:hypothetical protein
MKFASVTPFRIHGEQSDGWRSGPDLYDVKANFCGLRDEFDNVIYTPSLAGGMQAGRYPDWAARSRDAGYTHMIVGDFHAGGYPGYPFGNPDWTRSPGEIRRFLETLLNTPSADGRGFTPCVWLDGGAYNSSPRWRVDNDWPVIFDAMTQGGPDLRNHVIVVPGWELITASQWTSADLSYGLQWLKPRFPHIGIHNSPGRVALSSNLGGGTQAGCPSNANFIPSEPPIYGPNGERLGSYVAKDDPWQGGEQESYKSHGGEGIAILFMQILPVQQNSNLYCDMIVDDNCPFNRWRDAALRVGGGYHGWSKRYLCAMETVATEAFRKRCTPDWCRDVASRCREVALTLEAPDYTGGPVTISYGNGLPW